MSKKQILLAAVLLLAFSTASFPAVQPETNPAATDLRMLVDTIRANRRGLIGVNLNLTQEEAAKFWPLYDRYDQDIRAIGDRMAALVDDYIANFRTLSNEKALQLAGDYLAADAERIKVRRDYLPEFAKILPGRTVARFYQIENKADAVIRYDLASIIPVVEEEPAGAAH